MYIPSKYSLVLNSFKESSKLLYDDYVVTDFNSFFINNFTKVKPEDIININTFFNTYDFKYNHKLLIKPFLSDEYCISYAKDVSILDGIVINKRSHSFENTDVVFKENLFLDKYDYSTSFTDIISEFKLPKSFLIKALTTGCPDEEFPQAKEWNNTLNQIIRVKGFNGIEELKEFIVDSYSNTISKKDIKISYKLLDLVYLSITGNFTLSSHTTLLLKIKDSNMLRRVLTYLIELGINKSIYNDMYNEDGYSIIRVNSYFIYNLFKTDFNNYSFILDMSKLFSNYLFNKIKNNYYFHTNSELSSLYLQEFLFRYNKLYSISNYENDYILEILHYFIEEPDCFVVNIKDITKNIDKDKVGIS